MQTTKQVMVPKMTFKGHSKSTRIYDLPDSENCLILCLLILTQYQRLTDRQTDRQTNTAPMPVSRSSIAERYKNKALDVT